MKKGFTLLLTFLFTSISLAISLGVASLILGEVVLSRSGRESQKAFYAADSGVECALYWDLEKNEFSDGSVTVSCAGENITFNEESSDVFIASSPINFDHGSCSMVIVDKSSETTIVIARGWSPCSGDRRVERALEVRYGVTD